LSWWFFGLWAAFGVLFVVLAATRGKKSALNQPVRLGPLEYPLRWFTTAVTWWHRLVALGILAAVAYGCVVDATTRLIVAITVTVMVAVTILWRRGHRRDPGAAA
jgi:hypothetical protein